MSNTFKMKKLILFCLFVLQALAHNAAISQTINNPIGTLTNGVYNITAPTATLQSMWEVELNQFEIKEGLDSSTMERYYYLLGTNQNKTTKGAVLLVLISNTFYLADSQVGGDPSQPTGSVTCTGCVYGCNPFKRGKNWYCDMDCPSNCVKTVTIKF